MTMKRLFRHTNTTLLRAALLLGAVILVNTQTKAQIENVTTGVIASQEDVATYNTIISNYPADVSSMVPDIVSSWTGDTPSLSKEHWDGSGTSSYYDRWNGTALDPSTHYKTTTITLPRGRYAVLTAARATGGATLSLKVNDNEVTMLGQGNTAKGITTSGAASFEGGTFANNGNGFGWRYFYILFDVTANNANVELRVSGSSSGEAWMSFTTPRLLTTFTPSTNISQQVSKTFFLNETVWQQDPREFTVQFYFDNWKIRLYDSNNQIVAELPIQHNGGSGPESYWYNYDRFHDHTLHFGAGDPSINYFYVRWYLKDKDGNVININNSLINDQNIYLQTIGSQGGVVWSSRMSSPYGDVRELHNILRMKVDGTPAGGSSFDVTNYSLVCAISDAGNEGVLNSMTSSDPTPINIEYTFYFVKKEISLTDKEVTHKMSYLREYADDYPDLDLSEQGLASDKDSDWWDHDKKTQKTNHFEITHYVKQGESLDVYFPTILDGSNDHVNYQRFYNYDDDEDLDGLKSHLSLDTNNGNVPYYLYKNGIVTGDRLYWEDSSPINHYAQDHVVYTNTSGGSFTLAADVSRYSDYTYDNSSDPLSGDLEEPTLTMRYIYYMKDAKEMATKLTACTDGSNQWLEEKTFHFPAKQVFYNDNKWEGYRGEFIGLRHVFSDYWVFNGSGNLVSAVNDNESGKIEVSIYDPNSTGIRLGGWNPNISPRGTTANPQVGDIIRVYYKDKVTGGDNNFNPRFKYGNNFDDFKALQDQIEYNVENAAAYNAANITDSYFQATIDSETTLSSLTSNGLRFQGRGFTLVKVECIPSGGGRYPIIIYDQETIFNSWDVNRRIENWRIKVGVNNEGNDSDYQGFYFYDRMNTAWGSAPEGKKQYGDSRFIVFRYPKGPDGKTAPVTQTGKEVYLRVYFNNGGTKYQLAQFTLIFDKGCETLPWKSVNGSQQVQGTDRDPVNLRAKAGKPIAKITFDYPSGDTYHFPISGTTRHHTGVYGPGGTIANSSPLPLTFDHTNYSFDGDGCNWAAYAMVGQKSTEWGNNKMTYPADDATAGYNIAADKGMQQGFLYIDASEQPGDICAMDFQGEFCEGDKLMCTGWITGSNRYSDNGAYRCPGGITLTVKGEPLEGGDAETIYRFCPGQCYELDNGTGTDGSNGADKVVWQQFYFEFSTTKKFKKYWMEVNNNCVSSNGGDFMLDNVEVYAFVPEVVPEMNTPICISKEANEMHLLKISVGFDKILSAVDKTEVTGTTNGEDMNIAFMFLEKNKFLTLFKDKLADNGITEYESQPITTSLLEIIIEEGQWGEKVKNDANYKAAYRYAFSNAKLGDITKIWDSNNPNVNKDAGILNFHWNTNFSKMETYSFAKAVNNWGAVFGETNPESNERFIVMNGNYPNQLPWKINTDYYIVPYNAGVTSYNEEAIYEDFNICSSCSKKRSFQIKPPLNILSLETSDETQELEVCEGKIPTLLADLTGFDIDGNIVPMKDINFDWWLGDKANGVLATLENYHAQTRGTVRLDEALSAFRVYYKDASDLDGAMKHLSKTPYLTEDMVTYLQELVDAGQLVLHQKSISIPAEKASDDDPYFYLVACPIHDEKFDQALNHNLPHNDYVAFFCDEPQGLRVKVGEKAPTLKAGFVPKENGFTSYDYTDANDAVLSIRLAKKAQFETVQHGEVTEAPNDGSSDTDLHFLWLPIRNAETETASGVIRKSEDYDVYLASTNDPIWDKNIYTAMSQTVPSLPVVGKIVQLTAINTKGNINLDGQNDANRLCIYFTSNFEVREGYNYTLSLPFQEEGDVNTCDGTMLINLKIVPDYEVWTGAAGNTDWNNDENWRRADYGELYADNGTTLKAGTSQEYKTNAWNYRTHKDRLFRKGFAPLYCTHILMKSDEWGDAPVLYDAIDAESGNSTLTASPFPNLRATSTPILKFDMQARLYDIWSETYGSASNKGRNGDLIAEMYQINSCDEIAFQPSTELMNAHLLNYNNAWVEYELTNNRWYLLGSPLQGTISGEWYAPTGTAQQKTTYYEGVTFGTGYDRYSPAIYQRSWDKAKAVLYEVGATYSTDDNPNDLALTEGEMPGSTQQGSWGNNPASQSPEWDATGADDYLDRLGYKPFGDKKANVAIKGVWSNTYNDATVDYTNGAFSVMVKNGLKNNDTSGGKAIIRLPKEDTMYDYYKFSETGTADGGTDTELSDVRTLNRALNRGRLKTDLLLPTSAQKTESEAGIYGDQRVYTRIPIKEADLTTMISGIRNHQETVSPGISDNLNYYLVANPFTCGLDMEKFFEANTGLEKKYWLLTETGQHLVQHTPSGWITTDGSPIEYENPEGGGNLTFYPDAVVAPGQGFFVEAASHLASINVVFSKDMQAQTRFGEKDAGTEVEIVVGTKQKMKEVDAYYDDDNDPNTPDVVLRDPDTGNVVKIEVPETDDLGNFVVEDITDNVMVYSYVPEKLTEAGSTTTVDKSYPLKARTRGEEVATAPIGLVITAQRGTDQSSTLVMRREEASNDFLPEEDTEVFINSDLLNVPTVYTLCGRLATTINSIHDFSCLPVGVESNSDAPCTLTFHGVEMLGDSVAFYDALEQELIPLESGATVTVSGQTQNRYYLVRSLSKEEAAAETHIQIFTEGLTARVIASTAEPIVSIRCYDTAGRLIHSASPQSAEYGFTLPVAGVYIIDAETAKDRKTKKVVAR